MNTPPRPSAISRLLMQTRRLRARIVAHRNCLEQRDASVPGATPCGTECQALLDALGETLRAAEAARAELAAAGGGTGEADQAPAVAGPAPGEQSEERSADQQVRAAQQPRYRALFDFLPDPCLVTDSRGVIREANPAAAARLGAAGPELVGQPLSAHVHREDRASFAELLEALPRRLRVRDWELRILPPYGGPFTASVDAALITGAPDEATGIRWLLHDISAGKRAEQALRAAEHRLALALRAGNMGVWEVDETTGIGSMDQTVAALLGFPPGTREVPAHEVFARMHPADRTAVARRVVAAWQGDGDYAAELRVVHPDGTVRWIAASGQVLFAPDGTPVRTVGVCVDISARKQTEAAARREHDPGARCD